MNKIIEKSNKLLGHFKFFICQIIWLFVKLWGTLTIKDPCSHCIIKSCCTERCEEKIQLLNFIFPDDEIKSAKITAAGCLFALVGSSGALLYGIWLVIADL